MCIALISRAHSHYALILLNNRDEYLGRPTLSASWWKPPDANVLGGQDLLRPGQGTWMGVTKQGLIAVLTNVMEEGPITIEARSRGSMVNAFLTQPAGRFDSTADFVKHLVEDGDGLEGVGGFSLVCGKIGQPLAVISNRTPSVEGATWIMSDGSETVGLSNAAFTDRTWTKVTRGEELLKSIIEEDVKESREYSPIDEKGFIEKLFELLSMDTLPKRSAKTQDWDSYVQEFRHSIFIPVVGDAEMDGIAAEDLAAARMGQKLQAQQTSNDGLSGLYGTQQQSLVLVSHQGHVTFVERTLYNDNGLKRTASEKRDRRFDFNIEGWES